MARTCEQATPPRAADLRVVLEGGLPETLVAGRADALFLHGHCFHARERVAGLELVVDGRRHTVDAQGMPRPDLLRWLSQTGQDPNGRSYRSGFWATVPLRPPPSPVARGIAIAAAVRFGDGAELVRSLGEVQTVPPPTAAPADLTPGTVAICMATFDPEIALFAEQVRTLREQSDPAWVCVISDGGSDPQRFAEMVAVLDGDPRFHASRCERRLGPYRNFERALTLAPAGAELVALCDQDDRWYPDKLETLRAALGTAELVYSDQRLVGVDGRVLRDSLWQGRRHERRNLASLLVANTAPGAAMLFRRRLLERALPFPHVPGIPYHDHWLALVALAVGELAYVDRPLYDYVQHHAAVQGAVAADMGDVAAPTGAAAPRRAGSRGWRSAYFGGYLPRKLMAQVLLGRCGPLMTGRKRRALALFAAAEHAPGAFAWLALRPLRRLIGRDDTLSGEVALASGILWRWAVRVGVAGRRGPGRRPWDASFPDPPHFEQRRLRRWRAGG